MNRLRGMPAGGFVVCGFCRVRFCRVRFCCVRFLSCAVLSCAVLLCAVLSCAVLLCAEREERAMWRWGRKKSVRALKKTGCPHGRPVRFCHRSFHRREFFGFRGDGSALEMAQRCLAMSGFAQCQPLCGAVPYCFLSGATPANGQISIALALEQAALRWLLSR